MGRAAGRLWALGAVVSLALGFLACGDVASEADRVEAVGSYIDLEPSAIIGAVDGDPDYLFGDVRSVAVDDSGFVYVGDRIGATVRAYDRRGAFVGQVAQEGQGPGEIYGWPADLTLDPGGDLYVRDGARITVFTRSGATGRVDSLSGLWTLPGYGNLNYDRSRIAEDGTYYYPGGSSPRVERPRRYYHVLRDGEVSADTLDVPYHEGMEARRPAFYRLGTTGGRTVDGLSRVPFSAVPTWGVTTRGTVVSADGRSHRLYETDLAGDTVRVIGTGEHEPRPIPEAERADSLAALEERIDSLPVPLTAVVNLGVGVADRELPRDLPSVVAVHLAMDDLVWVERWPPTHASQARFYDVFDVGGTRLGSISLKAPLVSEPPPYFGRGYVVGVVVDPGTGVQRVVLFTLPDDVGR